MEAGDQVALAQVPHSEAIFRDSEGRSFSQQRTGEEQARFAAQLYERIAAVLADLPATLPVSRPADLLRDEMRRMAECESTKLVRPAGARAGLEKMTEVPDSASRSDFREDALQFLLDWIQDAKGPQYCALLGEYGIGKTTTCKALTQDLLRRRETGEAVPFPIYLDLRNVGKDARRGLLLEDILSLVVDRSWKGGPVGAKVTARELIDLVENEGAVVIWDGLDEVLVHLDDDAGQLFTRQLYRIVPPAAEPRPALSAAC